MTERTHEVDEQFSHALVTGGAGFIGSNLANDLVRQGLDVTVVDDEYLGVRENLRDEVNFVNADVVEYDDFPESVDLVYHLAARSSYAMHEDGGVTEGCRVNVEGFVNILEQAQDVDCDTVVYASTSSIYGTHTTPATEEQAVEANTGYEASKLAREQYAEYYANYHGMQVVGLRMFSIYQGLHSQEGHKQNYANVISQFAEKLVNNERPAIYGDGTQTRDFTHVSDAVRAFHYATTAESGIYNIGSQNIYTFNEVVSNLNELLGTSVEPEYIDNPIPEHVYVHSQHSSFEKFAEETGWSPTVSFEEGLQSVCEPYLDN